jgi:hypothetical protein
MGMNYKDFNLLEAIEQIAAREQANLADYEMIEKASAEPLKEVEAMQKGSEAVLEAIAEISERTQKGETR